jgi:N,N'-diacetyllegionaminate synthase
MKHINFYEKIIGSGHQPYIIAEIGSNHNGDMDIARKLVDAASACGAHAVKFQSWDPASLVSKAEYNRNQNYGNSEADKHRHFGTLEEMIKTYYLRPEQHYELAAYCKTKNIHFSSSAFSKKEVDLLKDVGVPFIKVASMDTTTPPLLDYIGRQGLPVILSTGMSTLGEIETAWNVLRQAGCKDIALLHCVSIYPTPLEDIHLRNIEALSLVFDVPVGFSDHSMGTDVPLMAMGLGACIIEKHFTLDKTMQGWDHWISADPAEMAVLGRAATKPAAALLSEVQKLPHFELIAGSTVRTVSAAEIKKRDAFRRCIVARTALKAGHVISENDLDYKRPGNKISPTEMPYIIGRELLCDVEADHEFEWTNFGKLVTAKPQARKVA